MLPYLILFILILLISLEHKKSLKKLAGFNWFLLFLIFIFFVGMRYNTGGDFEIYYELYLEPKEINTQFFYNLITSFFYKINLPFQVTVFLCASIFFFSLFKFSLLQNSPYLSIYISFPILITIVSMGYMRQSLSLAFLFLAINSFYKKNNFFYYFNLIIGILFHLSLLIIFPIKQFAEKSSTVFYIISGIFLLVFFYFFYDSFFILLNSYFYSSDRSVSLGAIPRIILNIIPSVIYLIYYKKFPIEKRIKRFYLFIAICSIASSFFVFSLSTLVDRINIYFVPIQLFVFSNMEYIFKHKINHTYMILFVIFLYFIYFLIWSLYGSFTQAWFPYKNILFEL